MPPVRTVTGGTAKPMRTERTHEENQERAYIAASRRSDRSLEARIESARRASEIHKKRTGRALRVTEQDVLNEEMYEEEDDDLPAQMRRLQAHLSHNFPYTNQRFESYMMANVAMRNYMLNNPGYMPQNQAVAAPYANPPVFSNNFSPQQMAQNYQAAHGAAAPSPSPTTGYRAHPYAPQSFRANQPPHGRSASFAGPMMNYNAMASPTTPGGMMTEEQRRMSLPVQHAQNVSPSVGSVASNGSGQRPSLSRSDTAETTGSHSSPYLDGAQHMPTNSQVNFPPSMAPSGATPPTPGFGYRADPLTPSIPLNQQQILATAGGMNSFYPPTAFSQPMTYPYSHAGMAKQQDVNIAMGAGMNQTLSGNPLGLQIPSQQQMMMHNMSAFTPSPTSALSLPSAEMQGSGWITPYAAGPGADGGFDFGDFTLSSNTTTNNTAAVDDYNFDSFINDE